MPEDHRNERPKSPPDGDDRTPAKTQGQIEYAEKGQNTAKEGGGAYAPHDEAERANPNQSPEKKKSGEC